MDREERRRRTIRYGTRARDVHLSWVHSDGKVDCICERSVWFFAKRGAISCGCKRRKRGNPKLVVSLCHMACSVGGYHPSARERIAGNRDAREWLVRVRTEEPDDVDL